MVRLLLLLPLLCLVACQEAEKAAKYAATRDLADPASAEFRNMHKNTEGVICGEVRGRQEAPGTFRKFIYFTHTGHTIMQPPGAPACPIADANCDGIDAAISARVRLSNFEYRFVTDCR